MNENLARLLEGNRLQRLDDNLFLSSGTWAAIKRLYGGEVMSQAISAANYTVDDDRHLHSFHSYFVRPGDPKHAVIYDVENIRDGGSFSSRRVTARQHGHAIFACQCSFQGVEEGLTHQDQYPSQPPLPEGLISDEQMVNDLGLKLPLPDHWPIEYRQINPQKYVQGKVGPPTTYVWFKADGDLPDDLAIHQQLLAFASDSHALATALGPHGVSIVDKRLKAATIDHSMWFHRPFDMSQWLLFEVHSPWAGNNRGLVFGKIFDQQANLVASCSQEGLIRLVES